MKQQKPGTDNDGTGAMPSDQPPQNVVMAPGEMLKFPTERQQSDFKKLRASGHEPWWRSRLCDACKQETPKAFECCSEACYVKLHPEAAKIPPP